MLRVVGYGSIRVNKKTQIKEFYNNGTIPSKGYKQ
jgi:hypothetical protein